MSLSSDSTSEKNAAGRVRLISEDSVADSTPKPDIHGLSQDMFSKTTLYLQGELESVSDDYKLLEDMNKVISQRYSDMKQVSQNIAKSLVDVNAKYEDLRPYLVQIDAIEESSRRLEEAAYALDSYVKALEQRFKQLEKR